MADKATKKAILWVLLAAVGLVLCILYIDALTACPEELILPYVALSSLGALQSLSGITLAILTLRKREQTRFGKIVTVIFCVSSIPTAIIALLWALLFAFSN